MMLKIREKIISNKVKVADSLKDRLIGLMFLDDMIGFDSLLLKPCQSIHTFFMKYPIDVIFLDKNFNIIKVIKNMKPWRVSGFYFKASQVLELRAGSIQELESLEGEEIVCIK